MNKTNKIKKVKPAIKADLPQIIKDCFGLVVLKELLHDEIEIARLTRERDEAREAIIGWKNRWKCAVNMAARAELERDEARKYVDRYRKRLDLTPMSWEAE